MWMVVSQLRAWQGSKALSAVADRIRGHLADHHTQSYLHAPSTKVDGNLELTPPLAKVSLKCLCLCLKAYSA